MSAAKARAKAQASAARCAVLEETVMGQVRRALVALDRQDAETAAVALGEAARTARDLAAEVDRGAAAVTAELDGDPAAVKEIAALLEGEPL